MLIFVETKLHLFMRKQWIMLVLAAMCINIANAQISWNIKAGIGFSDFKGSPLMTTRFSYKAGVGMDIPLSAKWALQPTLYFTLKGSRADIYYGNEQITEAEITHKLYYLELPLFAAYKIDLAPSTKLAVKAGPYVACGLKGKALISNSDFDNKGYKFPGDLFKHGTDYNQSGILDNKPIKTDAYKRLEAGMAVGIELNIHQVLLGAECTWGLTSFGKDFEGEDLRHAAGYLTIGYQF